jgi:GH3 auxin-responsive promoter
MRFRSILLKPFAQYLARDIRSWSANAVQAQVNVFQNLIEIGKTTAFGKDHDFATIRNYEDFKARVPLRDYEGLRSYIDRIKAGETDVLWRGKPLYFAKTSGTTSGVKYIPLTRDSMPNHFESARNALFNYAALSGNYKWLDGKLIFLSGSPELGETAGIKTGRLSGIVNYEVPAWLRTNQLPSYPTNCIDDWETKLEAIVRETQAQDMTLISGIPPWVQMYYERLLAASGKKDLKTLFPNFSVFVYGGVNFEPYRPQLEELVGKRIDSVETYPASEGFIAFQDNLAYSGAHKGLLLNVNSGIFFEFVPANEIFDDNPSRFSIENVEMGVNYAIIINNNAGLWGYNIGDTVEFVSLNPYRIRVTGRIKHFISAFGEHVIGKEVDESLNAVAAEENVRIVEFTVAPQVNPANGEKPYHEWLIEFDNMPENMAAFAQKINAQIAKRNIYYNDLMNDKVLQCLKITPLPRNAFREYMRTQGKLGGQNKVPRLSNDRTIADSLV